MPELNSLGKQHVDKCPILQFEEREKKSSNLIWIWIYLKMESTLP